MDDSDMGLDLFTAPFGGTPVAAAAPLRETPMPQAEAPVTQPKVMAAQAETLAPSAHQHDVPEEPGTGPSLQDPHTETKAPEPEQPKMESKAPKSGQPQAGEKSPGQPDPPKELALDMSDHGIPAGKPTDTSGDAKRKAHEEAEAERRARWEAGQAAKKQAEADAIRKLESMDDDEIISASTERVRKEVERITRRNMKECVAGHIQSICRREPAFARRTMHPKKSMAHCFQYINRMAKEYIRQEMEDNGDKPQDGVYGGDVPDGLCYQWAEDYFHDMDAPEDKEKEETFVPRPYAGPASKQTKKANSKKKAAKKEPEKKKEPENYRQLSLTEVI